MSKQRVLPRVCDIAVGKRNAATRAETAQPAGHRGAFGGRQRIRIHTTPYLHSHAGLHIDEVER